LFTFLTQIPVTRPAHLMFLI